jgi:hypothetical protein
MWEIIISIVGAIIIGKMTYNYLENNKAEKDAAIKAILIDLLKVSDLQQDFNNKIHEYIATNKIDLSKLTFIELSKLELDQNIKGRIYKL